MAAPSLLKATTHTQECDLWLTLRRRTHRLISFFSHDRIMTSGIAPYIETPGQPRHRTTLRWPTPADIAEERKLRCTFTGSPTRELTSCKPRPLKPSSVTCAARSSSEWMPIMTQYGASTTG